MQFSIVIVTENRSHIKKVFISIILLFVHLSMLMYIIKDQKSHDKEPLMAPQVANS